jgi:hypothetical protein
MTRNGLEELSKTLQMIGTLEVHSETPFYNIGLAYQLFFLSVCMDGGLKGRYMKRGRLGDV